MPHPKKPPFVQMALDAERSPEFRKLKRLLSGEKNAIAYPFRLWAHCMEQKTQGMAPADPAELADVCQYEGPLTAEQFYEAMLSAGYFDEFGTIAGWEKRYAKAEHAKQAHAEREAERRARDRAAKQALIAQCKRPANSSKRGGARVRRSKSIDDTAQEMHNTAVFGVQRTCQSRGGGFSMSYDALQASADIACGAPVGSAAGLPASVDAEGREERSATCSGPDHSKSPFPVLQVVQGGQATGGGWWSALQAHGQAHGWDYTDLDRADVRRALKAHAPIPAELLERMVNLVRKRADTPQAIDKPWHYLARVLPRWAQELRDAADPGTDTPPVPRAPHRATSRFDRTRGGTVGNLAPSVFSESGRETW